MTKIIKGDWIMEKDEKIDDNIIVAGNIYGKDGKRFNLDCWNLNCWNLNCWDLNCWDLDCRDLNCRDLNCRDLDCWDLKCLDLDCWDLKCLDLDCWDLNCGDLNCRDLNFWGVAFAYKNIKAKSIKSDRDNNKCFVLDGAITLDGEDIGKEWKK